MALSPEGQLFVATTAGHIECYAAGPPPTRAYTLQTADPSVISLSPVTELVLATVEQPRDGHPVCRLYQPHPVNTSPLRFVVQTVPAASGSPTAVTACCCTASFALMTAQTVAVFQLDYKGRAGVRLPQP